MAAYDSLPKFARDYIKDYGCQAIQVYNKLCEFQGDNELLRKYLAKAVISYRENSFNSNKTLDIKR